MGAGRLRIPATLEKHDPAGGRAAAAVLVLRGALAAVPVLPPDPLEVVHLEHEEGDDPEQDLGARHAAHGRSGPPPGQWAGRPNFAARRSYCKCFTSVASRGARLRLRTG